MQRIKEIKLPDLSFLAPNSERLTPNFSLEGLADEFWSLIKSEWIESDASLAFFLVPLLSPGSYTLRIEKNGQVISNELEVTVQ